MDGVRAIKDVNMNLNARNVVIAAQRLLWLCAAIAALFAMSASVGLLPAEIPTGAAVGSSLIAVAILAMCAAKIGVGRNWARWFMLGYLLLSLLMLSLAAAINPHPLLLMPLQLVVFGVIQCVIQLAALVLVFMPASRIWFTQAARGA